MESERWRHCIEIFDAAIERPAHERTAFLQQRCQGDELLRGKVELLLKSHEEAGEFIESPAFEVAPELLLDDADALIGQSLGRYRIESVLGVGGMGVVYLAQDERLGRKVGLKLLPPSLVADEAQLERLKREARTASALNHPNIVTIHEIGEVDGTYYIATEFIEGATLRATLAQGPILPNEALEIALQITSALSVAHAAGIVHRDIKPENIMLRPDGYVKVLDFGIAKFTQQENSSAGVEGTKRYMSPEQALGEELDARSDIWSLGVTLREMMAAPVPPELERIISRALSQERDARYASATDLRADLHQVQRKLEAGARRGWRIAAVLLGALVVAAIVFVKLSAPSLAPLPGDKSIAVLPFSDLSQAKDQEYFCDGISEEILDALAKVDGLRVVGRTSSFSFKGKNANASEIGKKLNVANVLEGSLRREGNRVRITTELIDARNGFRIWSETYERELQGVFALQDEITRAIVEALKIKLAVSLPVREERNTEAYDLYLQGLFFSNKSSEADLRRALSFFQGALEKDPTFSRAWTGIAKVWYFLADVYVKPLEAYPASKEAALKAIALDEKDAEAHCYLSEAKRVLDWDLAGADAELTRAPARS